ncbi:MAG: 50S ribosomal protein L29 [Tepidanaerobacter acetatoxydans]|jgi:large subunit ribosomal protein L29|uniref:Large ribosomal subunit protein uL29 n=1 Tax=Tepidanaerobacter acetatoxydans (strain DSM 21804 / JCM 16047 / Re1) TaxID=1209989 RepID=F4LSU3_TEPAE|nr:MULTISPECIES: 50S ribosomal protein L29 [Tepidanaerobacter]AEE90406.1 ribosomal protein L29 [Tepidanaerobacter acetatoxydans Re1]NLU09394.1 50S ribosomal protein L29 [Tepidanaerobacter acetatoxydans]CCP24900.1 ribosomal protein L29 [Tepidanaerobacter acetatoxydans Re1]
MKLKQIRDLTDQELLQKEKDLKGELFNLRFQAATGQLDNPMRIREVRKTIARIKTVLTERQNEKLKLGSQK